MTTHPQTRRAGPAARLLATLAAVAVTCLLTVAPAYSQDPFDLPDELVDEVGAVQDEAAVRAAQDRLHDEGGLQLFVVFVDDFGGYDGADWAAESAELSHLGDQDLLVAVATQERAWGMSVSEDSGISEGQQDRVAAEFVEPALRDGDWDGAAVAAAEGFLAMSQEESTTGRNVLIGLGGAAGLGVLGLGAKTVRRRMTERALLADQAADRTELSERVGGDLVALDNALAASENELQYAEAEFAPELTTPFRQAVEESRAESVEAYRLREQIGDVSEVTNHAQTLERFTALLALITHADARLDEHTEAFNNLRRLADRAPERIQELSAALAAAGQRVQDTEPLLATRSDLRAGQREQFADIITTCRTLLGQGQGSLELAAERLAASGAEDAVLPLKAAEQALTEVTAQTDRLADIDALVAGWQDLLTEAADSLAADVSDAERLAPADTAVTGPAAAARTALARVEDPAEDPVDLAEELADTERTLDAALAGYREAQEKHRKAVATAEAQLRRTTSTVETMEADLRRHRGLADERERRNAQEGRDLLAQGSAQVTSDPEGADATLRLAGSRASSVISSLRSLSSVDDTEDDSGWGFGGFGGSSGSNSRRSSSRRSSSRRSSSRRSSSRRSSSRRSSSRRSSGGRF